MRARGLLAALAVVVALASTGCGIDDGEETLERAPDQPAPSPIVRLAVAGPVQTLDPAFARTRSERLIARQIYEPLVTRITPPFAAAGLRRGPARSIGVADQGRQWRFELRPGVVFHDGSALNGEAVVANHARWVQSGIAERLLPELDSVFSPRPGEVRFQLNRPVPDFPARLSVAALGLISPESLPIGVTPMEIGAAGTGPYALDEFEGSRLLLAGFPQWWGTRAGLGPGINQLDFRLVPGGFGRLDQLLASEVSIADDLGPRAVAELEAQPLVATVGGGDVTVGITASVRGLTTVDPDQSLSQLWLTELR